MSTPSPAAPARLSPWEAAAAAALVAGALLWAVPALLDGNLLDFGLAYRAGEEAWRSGRPERLRTWMSTPALAVAMALLSRLVRPPLGVRLLTAVNLALAAATIVLVWGALRPRVPRWFWWVSLTMAAFYSPLISTVFYKQFNIVVFALGLAGFAAARGGRTVAGAALAGVSIALKPLLVLLPLALLARRDSRRAGAWCLAWIALSAGLCQGVLAWRAGSVGPLSPLAFLGNFQDKTASWIYHPDNFSPQGLVHKANPQGAGEARGLQRAVLGAGLLLLLMMVNHLLRAHAGGSWEAFAFACLLSPMVSPVAWSHYQVLLAPLLLLLGVRFLRDGAHWTHWAWLLFAYALAALAQQPLGTVPGALRLALTGRPYSYVETTRVLILSSFAQYVLLAVALLWYARGRTDERSI